MIVAMELLIWVLGAVFGFLVERLKPEHPIPFLVAGTIGISTLVNALSGELFDNGLLLLVDMLQALAAVLVGYYGQTVLNRLQSPRGQ
jgi:hypothetical protein